jgi:N-acetylglucosaminyl-diphospho-decaprenol L-rhamnosyltransferase
MSPAAAPAQDRESVADTPSASAVIVHYGDERLLGSMLESLRGHEDATLFSEIIIVANGGPLSESASRMLEAARGVRVVVNGDTGYASGVNAGVSHTGGEFIAIMNNDLLWRDNCGVRPAIDALSAPGVAVTGAQLLNEDGAWQRSHGRFPSVSSSIESALMFDTLRERLAARRSNSPDARASSATDYVDGAFMCVRRTWFDAVGGFDERIRFYGEDADFCARVHVAGGRVLFVPAARLIHLRGATSSKRSPEEFERKLLEAKVMFVERRDGRAAARVSRWFMRAALAVRALVYTAAGVVSRTSHARARAQAARARHLAVNRPGRPAP